MPVRGPSDYPPPQYQYQQPPQPQPQPQQSTIALFNVGSDATNSLYVDGVPNDTSEREVSRTLLPFSSDIFRPFPGFQCVRLIQKTANNNRQYFLCFVDFENAIQATIAMSTLQGYRFDKNDKMGLKISYANDPKELKDKRRRR
jgi:hypothetical protein